MLLEDGCKALTAGQSKGFRKPSTCHYCHKPGHFKKDCRKYLGVQKKQANVAEKKKPSGSDGEAFVTIYALNATSSGAWIIDSGATCQMCNDKELFIDMRHLNISQQVTLGDRSLLEGPTEGMVKLDMILPGGSTQKRKLKDVLYVPKFSYRLLSVSKASEARKTTSQGVKF